MAVGGARTSPWRSRVARVVALALLDGPRASADVGVDEGTATAEVSLGAADDYDLGRLVTRLEVAAPPRGCAPRWSGAPRDGDVQAPQA